ncbi:TetR/AcrR family transcriptional regulator [Acidaminobacter sp. JC074]|uniref:TetR/AcrR family transcriptional regulator n=1 Tax=Acidaminobacter sp. JC074 TaxID=2530199 RepID=UPI001F10281D|nr:TetR/AcrR family transcriptional regulator [Acidaminobacter sp. JC074]
MTKRKTREERRQEIFEAAKTVFVKKGFQRTTMEDIIELTDLSKGGFYYYYSSTKEILIDMMKRGNTLYMTLNPYFPENFSSLSENRKIDLLMDAFIEKCTVVTDDRKVYTMFIHESMYDESIWREYVKLEEEFYSFVCTCLNLNQVSAKEDFLFLSRMMNAILFGQNVSRQPDIILDRDVKIRQMFKPLLVELIHKNKI